MKATKSKRVVQVVKRYLEAKTFILNEGDLVYYGKYKNKKGVIKGFDKDNKGNHMVIVEPHPKGRKKDKVIQLFRIWHHSQSPDGQNQNKE
jgi:hypothetical protein